MAIDKLTNWMKKNLSGNSQNPQHKTETPKTEHPQGNKPHHPGHPGHSVQHNNRFEKKFHTPNRPSKNLKPGHNRYENRPQLQQDSLHGAPLSGKKMRIIPLGGLEEVGKNIMVVEYEDDIVLIDAGMSFAGPDMLGVDYIVPDVTYVEQNKHKVRGIIFTHGHLDHIGAAQYVVPRVGNPPLYATKLTCGLLKNRMEEFGLQHSIKLHEYNENSKLRLGKIEVEFFRVNHSIPEGMGVYIKTPGGSAVHTGDFKFDYTPAIDQPANLQRIAEIGKEGVDVLMIDSTNALKPGFCKSEREIAKTLEGIISDAKGRLIIAAFASLIGRINQIIEFAAKHNRKVFLSGRSMVENMELCARIGYTTPAFKNVVRKMGPQVNSLPPSQVIILTTGAQGEAMSALSRMAINEHAQIKIKPGDTVVLSASPIPGNELAVVNVINNLYLLGANVITNGQMDVHTSGHAHQEELKLMYSLTKPKCYVPIHGEIFMRIGHGQMIKEVAGPSLHVTILENGDVLEINKQGIRKSKQKIPANDILIDGLGFGDIGSKVIQERTAMSQDGIVILLFRAYEATRNLVGDPDIISRGFLYVKESTEIAQEIKHVSKKAFENSVGRNPKSELKELKGEIAASVGHFIRKRIGREPMIIPIINYI